MVKKTTLAILTVVVASVVFVVVDYYPETMRVRDGQIFRIKESTNMPLFYVCTHRVSFMLGGSLGGYEAYPALNFSISIGSVNAGGVYRFNFTIYYNDQRVLTSIRDETFESGHQAMYGRIVPSELTTMEGGRVMEHKEWLEWSRYLKSGNNTITINSAITTLSDEFHFGDGEVQVEIGPMTVEVRRHPLLSSIGG